MRPLARCLLALLVLMPRLAAQDPAALEARERKLRQEAAEGLGAFADQLTVEKQHGRALLLRREVWMEYDEEHVRARELTGFVRVGSLWRLDPEKLVLERDMKGDARKLRKIDRDLDRLEKQLCAEHRALAEAWTAAGTPQRAQWHWRRVLRFVPDDEAAAAGLAIREFEGFSGTAEELHMLRRGRCLSGAVDWLNRQEFPVQELAGETLPLLAAANLPHRGVRSAHYTVWGTLAPGDLAVIARDCERALLLAHTLMGTSSGEPFAPVRMRNLVFVLDPGHYAAALEVCRGQFAPDRFAFLRDVVDQCFVEHGGESLRLHKAMNGLEVARDQAVRGVVQDALGVWAEGLWEGVGHMACGLLFGRTLTFLLEQETERTRASGTSRTLAPDLEVWMQIAKESAWAKSDTRTSELVLISAARFTVEQRVKAWAICHYFAHWRPQYILELDKSRSEKIHTPPDVEAEFLRRTGYELPRIDAEWRSFWARGDALRAAMAKPPSAGADPKAQKALERGRSLVDAINAQRAAWRVGPIGWFVDVGPEVLAVRRYEKELQKAEREQEKREKQAKSGKPVEPVAMPTPPAALAGDVLWSRAEAPADAVAEWLASPARRDRLLHPGRDLCALPADEGGWLCAATPAPLAAARGEPLPWPRQGQRVRGGAPLSWLGPRLVAALQRQGVAADAVVGTPLTLHFARAIDPSLLAKVRCSAHAGRGPIGGVVVAFGAAADDAFPGDTADGVVAFVPLEPWPSGVEIEVQWELPSTLLPPDRRVAPLAFRVE